MSKSPTQIHFVCRQHRASDFTDNGDGTFTTGLWRVCASAANSVQTISLHDTKRDAAWAHGDVLGRELVQSSGARNRYAFTVRKSNADVSWPAAATGSSEKEYV